jgi:hypothetical protein
MDFNDETELNNLFAQKHRFHYVCIFHIILLLLNIFIIWFLGYFHQF